MNEDSNTELSLEVKAGRDLLLNWAKCDPRNALEELIWNSLDADAKKIKIFSKRNELGALDEIRMIDNGHGFNRTARELFAEFGTSFKKFVEKTPEGRKIHGKEGKGRYKSLSLGEKVTWKSVRCLKEEYTISKAVVSNFKPGVVDFSDTGILFSSQDVGVEVLIENPTDGASRVFDANLPDEIALKFAPYLFSYPDIEILIDGVVVDYTKYLKQKTNKSVSLWYNGSEYLVEMLLCIWGIDNLSVVNLNKIYFCNENGFPVGELYWQMPQSVVNYTLHLKNKFFDDENNGNVNLGDLDPFVKQLRLIAQEFIRDVNSEILSESAGKIVDELKNSQDYPYSGDSVSVVDNFERQCFDEIAKKLIVLDPSFATRTSKDKNRRLKALKIAMSSGDDMRDFVMKEILELKSDQINELFGLLKRTSLSKIIDLSNKIVSRLDFIQGLEVILFDPDFKKRLKERQQLHKILADNIWIFGEQYMLGTSDISLKNVCKKHRGILELDELAFDTDVDYSHLDTIPDLMLFCQRPEREKEFDHLVIELKAPNVVLKEKEFNQIKKYARTVSSDEMFDKNNTHWKFILINNDIDSELYDQEANQKHRPRGLVTDSDNCEVWVKRWAEVIQDAKARHRMLKDSLDLEISNEHGLNYLRSNYVDQVPK